MRATFSSFLRAIIFLYQRISFWLGLRSPCRFYPSCSHYAERALDRYGPWKGAWKSADRLIRCNPWNSGGIDLP